MKYFSRSGIVVFPVNRGRVNSCLQLSRGYENICVICLLELLFARMCRKEGMRGTQVRRNAARVRSVCAEWAPWRPRGSLEGPGGSGGGPVGSPPAGCSPWDRPRPRTLIYCRRLPGACSSPPPKSPQVQTPTQPSTCTISNHPGLLIYLIIPTPD